LKSPGGAGQPRELGCRSGGERNGEHRHGLVHVDAGRTANFASTMVLDEGKIQFFAFVNSVDNSVVRSTK
jgi:hypothetical protein